MSTPVKLLSRICVRIMLAAAIVLPSGVYAKEGYSFAPVPSWVKPFSAGVLNPDSDAVGGERHLLLDRQQQFDGKKSSYFRHHITEIVGQAGLSDNSSLSVVIDPSYEHLELHTATVTRDGRTTDRLKRARIDVARTEDSTHLDLFNGELTVLVVFPDIRVGDVVETRYTIHGKNPVFDSRHHSSWRVRWGVPVERSVLRISVPQSMQLTYTDRPEADITEENRGGLHTVQWFWDSIEESDAEENTPDWYPDPNRLDVSAYSSWKQVSNWGSALFTNRSANSARYRSLSERLVQTANEEGLELAIAKAIDHVQQRIRYYGIELGVNSHRPHSPDEVLENGYGDCKDKATLLVALLDDIGVKAWPILVSSRIKKGIVEKLPSPGVFDHVVVLVEHNGEQYWVDATDNSQAGLLGKRGQPEYGAGVVLGRAGDPLIIREETVASIPDAETHDKFYLSSVGGPVDLVTTSTFRGDQANRFRSVLDRSGRRGLGKNYRDYYERVYGELTSLGELIIDQDDINNVVTVTESYRLKEFWSVDKRSQVAEFDAYALGIRNQIDEFEDVEKNRVAPLPVSGPIKMTHRIQFFPNVASTERELEETSFEVAGLHYQDTEYVLGDSLVFDASLEIKSSEINADLLKDYTKFHDRVMRRAQSGRYYRDVHKDDIDLGLDTTQLLKELGGLF